MRVDFSEWFSRPGLVARKFTYSQMDGARDFELEVHFDIQAGLSVYTFVTFIITDLDLTRETSVRTSLRAMEGGRPDVSVNMKARPDGEGAVIMSGLGREDHDRCLSAFLDGKAMHFAVDTTGGERLIRLPMPNDAVFRTVYVRTRDLVKAADDAEMGEGGIMGRINRFAHGLSTSGILPEAEEAPLNVIQTENEPRHSTSADMADAEKGESSTESAEDDVRTPLKPQGYGFRVNDFIVYPVHGVGQILAIEEQEIAGAKLELFVINFMKDKMTLRVPTAKIASVGIRKLSEASHIDQVYRTLRQPCYVAEGRWSRLAQEYEAKINSGDIIALAEVVRDLYRPAVNPGQSYSERQLYEAALDRLSREIAVVQHVTEENAIDELESILVASSTKRTREG